MDKEIIIGIAFVGFAIIYFITLHFMNEIIDEKDERIRELEFAKRSMNEK